MKKTLALMGVFCIVGMPLAWAQTANNCSAPSSMCSSARFVTSAPSGTVGVQLNTGARVKLGSGTTDYLYSDGTGTHSGGHFTATTALISDAAAGADGYKCTNVGCRLSLGNVARYLADTGTLWQFNTALQSTSTIQGTQFNATVATGSNAYGCTNVGCRLALGNSSRYFYDDGLALHTPSDLNIDGVLSSSTHRANSTQSLSLLSYVADGATAVNVIVNSGSTFANSAARLLSVRNNTAEKFAIMPNGYARFSGATFAFLPTCNSTTEGQFGYDSTNQVLVYCDGTSWKTLSNNTTVAATYLTSVENTWSFGCLNSVCEVTDGTKYFSHPWIVNKSAASASTFAIKSITCDAMTAGTGAGKVVLELRNTTDSTSQTLDLGAGSCTALAPGSIYSATGNLTLTANKVYAWRYHSTSTCTTLPQVMTCTAGVLESR